MGSAWHFASQAPDFGELPGGFESLKIDELCERTGVLAIKQIATTIKTAGKP
jgi:hypothetical protein